MSEVIMLVIIYHISIDEEGATHEVPAGGGVQAGRGGAALRQRLAGRTQLAVHSYI